MNQRKEKQLVSKIEPRVAPKGRYQNIAPVLTGFAALYLVIIVSQFIAEPGFRTSPVLFLAVLTLAVFFGARLIVGMKWVSVHWKESIGALFAALVIINGFVQFYLLNGFADLKSLGLLGVGLVCFFLPSRKILLVLSATLMVWLFLSWSAGTTQTWIHFAFGLFTAVGLRIYSDLQANKLEVALDLAEKEIEKRHETERALRESEKRYSLAAKGSRDGLWDWNMTTGEVYFSARWELMLGYEEGELENTLDAWIELVHPSDVDRFKAAFDRHSQDLSEGVECEYRILREDGSYYWVLARGLAVLDEDGNPSRMAGSQTDVHSRKLAEQELYHNASHDPLTGLPNRLLFSDRLERALERRRRGKENAFAVIFLDLNRFKGINDSLGHLVGDQLLAALALRLNTCVRKSDTVARFGGDEFAILIEDLKRDEDAELFAERLHETFKKPFLIADREVFVNASLGIVVGNESYSNTDELIRDADTAMYRAKVKGDASTKVFDKEMHQQAVTSWRLENDLRVALRDSQFLLHYQPIVSFNTGRVVACEALLRWKHPERGLLTPNDFLFVAEETGVIIPIGWWVLEEACRQLKDWESAFLGDRAFSMSINLAGAQFNNGNLIENLERSLDRYSISSQRIILEITESTLTHDDTTLKTLRSLQDRGFRIHLDDFGRGAYSFSYLHQLHLSASKIDRSFISELGREKSGREVVRAMVNLIHDLGMQVIVEGVETGDQMDQTREFGCEFAQGYYIGKPVEPEAFVTRFMADGLIHSKWVSTGRPN